MKHFRAALVVALVAILGILPLSADIHQSPLYGKTEGNSFPVSSFLEQNRYTDGGLASKMDANSPQMLQVASNSETYRIVPGDTFSLSYYSGKEVVGGVYQVDMRYQVAIPELGFFDCAGKTFSDLKDEITQAIQLTIPSSIPRLDFVSCGMFEVSVVGEVRSHVPLRCWGGSTLRDAMASAGDYASSRKVAVVHADGTQQSYDLYKAITTGDASNNPSLRPGDKVRFEKASKLVVLDGAVYNPGTYQLLEGETLDDLIDVYGNGLLPSADPDGISILHVEGGKASVAQAGKGAALANFDRVNVVGVSHSSPTVSVEGAIAPGSASSTNKILYSFFPGEKLSHMLRAISGVFIPQSNLEAAYVISGGKVVSVDCEALLAGDTARDLALQAGDRLVVPFVQTFVTVNGAVNAPGRVAYADGRDAAYYIGLSGGYAENARSLGSFKVYDAEGNRLQSGQDIPNGAVITVDKSNFDRDLTRTAAVLGIVTTLLTITESIMKFAK